ncbi:protein MIGRI [Alysiella crassa]|uniref:Uncharacterized protein n=1 Tax=Alysiella crassa TaxID=153491 RepID=A0A376BJW2_9NEIS|nr:hypothetical protein [Alysiella crassa]UOP07759.1 hypothetical protein LVJ80_05260 [Alysiella crassa]SSY69999.1 Uncharacterised protein [Alysiella crassa]
MTLLNKILAAALLFALLIFIWRVLLGKHEKQVFHQTVQFIAKIIVIVAIMVGLLSVYQRYF